jgi:malonyl CoA-acyl carrier protein transacylase
MENFTAQEIQQQIEFVKEKHNSAVIDRALGKTTDIVIVLPNRIAESAIAGALRDISRLGYKCNRNGNTITFNPSST